MSPKILGLTGGIGSGKSTVAKVLQLHGMPLYEADKVAKDLYFIPSVKSKVIALLGEKAYEKDTLNRSWIAQQVFNDADLLKSLNAILHPAVKDHFEDWISQQDSKWIVREAAILFESGSYRDCDAIITVAAPEQTRIERVVSRDRSSEEQVRSRITNQWTDEQRHAKSDYEILNFGNHLILPQIEKILSEIKA